MFIFDYSKDCILNYIFLKIMYFYVTCYLKQDTRYFFGFNPL